MLRDYQQRTVNSVRDCWRSARSVLIAAPTAAGKTVMMAELLSGFANPLWMCHRRDLLEQTKARLNGACRVESVQSLASKKQLDASVDLLVADEAHHIRSDSWSKVVALFPHAKLLGGSATPQRHDGLAMGDAFERLVVAAHYSELLKLGFISQCRVFRPSKDINKGIACSPVGAYLKYAEGRTGFVFVSSLKTADKLVQEFLEVGVATRIVSGKSKAIDRACAVDGLQRGKIKLIVNCAVLTEGVDIPSASVCILARRCQTEGLYLQTVGRVLRSHPGKSEAILIDLVSASARHGLPNTDREYSLSGSGIKSAPVALRTCYQCGAVMEAFHKSCISCATKFIPGVHRPVKIHSMELREVYNGSETPDGAKLRELVRLTSTKRFSAAAKQFEALFGRRPTQMEWAALPMETVQREYEALKQRFPFTQASAILKSYVGYWPSRILA